MYKSCDHPMSSADTAFSHLKLAFLLLFRKSFDFYWVYSCFNQHDCIFDDVSKIGYLPF